MEKKTRENTFQIQGWKDRIVFLGIIALLGGPGIISTLVPGMGINPETISQLEKKHSLIETKIDNLHDDLMHEINILDAKIGDTTETCMLYRNNDRNEMEDLRQDVAILKTLINQCLERTQ